MRAVSVLIKRLGAAFVLLGVICAPAVAGPAEDNQVLELFAATAFGSATGDNGRLFKWDRPIRVRLVGRAPARYRGWAEAHMRDLARLTGHEIEMVTDISADVLIYFVPQFQDVIDGKLNAILRRYVADPAQITGILKGYALSKAICGGQLNAEGSALKEAIVFVPINQPPPVGHNCLVTQATRVMGLPFPAPAGAASVFGADSPHSHLTAIDRRLIGLLYDPRLKPGMKRDAALAVARTIVSEQ